MARRFPVTTKLAPRDASPWKAIKPADGDDYKTNYYEESGATIDSMDPGTYGVVHLVQDHQGIYSGAGESEHFLFSMGTYQTNGVHLYRVCGPGAGATLDPAKYGATVGTNDRVTDRWSGQGNGAPTYFGTGPSTFGRLQVTAVVVDDDAYPDDGLYTNGYRHILDTTALTRAGSAGPMRLCSNSTGADNKYTSDWFVGFFFAEDAMSQEELLIWQQDILFAKRLPDVSQFGGTIPDYIFDVKSQMSVGSAQAPATWNSIGSGSSISVSRTGNLDVVEFEAELGPR